MLQCCQIALHLTLRDAACCDEQLQQLPSGGHAPLELPNAVRGQQDHACEALDELTVRLVKEGVDLPQDCRAVGATQELHEETEIDAQT